MINSAFFEFRVHGEDRFFVDDEKLHLGVFDGVGASTHPEMAAEICAKEIESSLDELPENSDEDGVKLALKDGWQNAKNAIKESLDKNNILGSTATTAIVAQVISRKVVVGQAGDSRLYVAKNNGQLRQITQDEGVGFYQVTNYISENYASPTIFSFNLSRDDLFLIATSDGVHDNLTNEEMEEIIKKHLRGKLNLNSLSKVIVDESVKNAENPGSIYKGPDDATTVVLRLLKSTFLFKNFTPSFSKLFLVLS